MAEVNVVNAAPEGDEVVGLKCELKPGVTLAPGEKPKMHLAHFGNTCTLGPGDVAKMRRLDAEFHIKKLARMDLTNPLTLKLMSAKELAKAVLAEDDGEASEGAEVSSEAAPKKAGRPKKQ